MAIYRNIKRADGSISSVRHNLETSTEHPLTILEEIVNELLDEREFISQLQEEEKPTDERTILIKFLESEENINMAVYAEPEDIVDNYLKRKQ
jgi:hypothetical protein